MLILTFRTDKPEAELGIYKDEQQLDYITWLAHRELAEIIHIKIKELLEKHHLSWQDIKGVAVFKGPGSFTGLRIGASVANALADSLQVPIVGTTGEDWLDKANSSLLSGKDDKVVIPEYGSPPHITAPRGF